MIWGLTGDIGLGIVKARADADGSAVAQVLRQEIADIPALKVAGTPGFAVNSTPLREFGEAQLKALAEVSRRRWIDAGVLCGSMSG
jgi:protein-disulfide isomerase